MTGALPRVGLLTATDPSDPDSTRVAAVLRHELGARLGPSRLVLATSHPTSDPDQVDWRPATPGWHRVCDAVVVFPGVDAPDVAPAPLITADVDPTDLAGLFDEQVDDVARDVRLRVHAHRRWLLPEGSLDPPATALDRQLAVEAAGEDPLSPPIRRRLHDLLDTLEGDLRAVLDSLHPRPDGVADIRDLERTLDAERQDHARTRAVYRAVLDELDRVRGSD